MQKASVGKIGRKQKWCFCHYCLLFSCVPLRTPSLLFSSQSGHWKIKFTFLSVPRYKQRKPCLSVAIYCFCFLLGDGTLLLKVFLQCLCFMFFQLNYVNVLFFVCFIQFLLLFDLISVLFDCFSKSALWSVLASWSWASWDQRWNSSQEKLWEKLWEYDETCVFNHFIKYIRFIFLFFTFYHCRAKGY